VFVEANAIAPSTARKIAELLAPSGCKVIDSGIVGSPPTEDSATSPTFPVCGPDAASFEPLTKFGLKMKQLDGPIGQASALKLAYGGIQKGVGAVGLAMILGAAHHGVENELREELLQKQPVLAKWLDKQIAQTFPKAYRFAGEMEEIAAFHEADPGSAKIYDGMAEMYEAVAQFFERDGTDGKELAGVVRFIES
jgi:3-hydroxyisobutyrate dehydrogenase-like beta-hydroxyacid dehydrogenase